MTRGWANPSFPSPVPIMAPVHPQHKTPPQPVLAFEPHPMARISLQFLLRAPSLMAGKPLTAASPQSIAISTHPGVAQRPAALRPFRADSN